MKKVVAGAICFLFLSVFCSTQNAHCAGETPEQFIKRFYTWYITVDEDRQQAINNVDIYRYVAKNTVKHVKEMPIMYGSDRRDYFLKMLDYPLNMSGVDIQVGTITEMGMDTFVAPVIIVFTFPDEYSIRNCIVVVVKKIDGSLKITKCMDIYPEA